MKKSLYSPSGTIFQYEPYLQGWRSKLASVFELDNCYNLYCASPNKQRLENLIQTKAIVEEDLRQATRDMNWLVPVASDRGELEDLKELDAYHDLQKAIEKVQKVLLKCKGKIKFG